MAVPAAAERRLVPGRRRASPAPGVVRLIDATGSSSEGWEEAVVDAVRSVRKEVSAPIGVEVSRQWADLESGRVVTYRVAARIAYRQALKGPSRRSS